MKLLIINEYRHSEIKNSDFVPRVGELVDMFYKPSPTVTRVLNWPSNELLKNLNAEQLNIQAVITVS